MNQPVNAPSNHSGPSSVDDNGSDYDVVVIGGGAAGLSAALVLTRARRRVVVDAGQPRNAPAAHMQGFLGSDRLPPTELLSPPAAQGRWVRRAAGVRKVSTITASRRADASRRPCFDVALEDGSALATRRVLVTTGLRDQLPDVPGAPERWGRDLLHCPYCHGYEVRDQPLGVLGGTPEAITHAHLIRQWSDDVFFFSNGTPHGRPTRAVRRPSRRRRRRGRRPTGGQRRRLTGVELVTGQVLLATRCSSGVEVHPQRHPAHRPRMREVQRAGWRRRHRTHQRSWSLGRRERRDPRAQVITAAGEGSAAAIAINNDLVDEDLPVAVALPPRDAVSSDRRPTRGQLAQRFRSP